MPVLPQQVKRPISKSFMQRRGFSTGGGTGGADPLAVARTLSVLALDTGSRLCGAAIGAYEATPYLPAIVSKAGRFGFGFGFFSKAIWGGA